MEGMGSNFPVCGELMSNKKGRMSDGLWRFPAAEVCWMTVGFAGVGFRRREEWKESWVVTSRWSRRGMSEVVVCERRVAVEEDDGR